MKKKNQEEIEEVELFSTEEYLDIKQICAILKDNNIPYIKKGFYTTFTGRGYYCKVKKIYVNKEDYNKASELISGFISYKDTNKQVEDDIYTPIIKKVRNILLIILIGIPTLLCILRLIVRLV